jgi:hypothetical protein
MPGDFMGKLTDLNIWNVPLKAAEVQQFMFDYRGAGSQINLWLVFNWSKVRFVEGHEGVMNKITSGANVKTF